MTKRTEWATKRNRHHKSGPTLRMTDMQAIAQAREEHRRTVTTISTRMREREARITHFRQATEERGESLSAAIIEAEEAMEQVKRDHHRAAQETGEVATLQRRHREHTDSLAAQKAATAALEKEVARLQANLGRPDAKRQEEEVPEVRQSSLPPL